MIRDMRSLPAKLVTEDRRAQYNPFMGKPVLRFAPSPNGHLHLGHALSALFSHDMARAMGALGGGRLPPGL